MGNTSNPVANSTEAINQLEYRTSKTPVRSAITASHLPRRAADLADPRLLEGELSGTDLFNDTAAA